MKNCVRVREVFKRIYKKNYLSGHEWTEHGPTTGYEVVGPSGVESKHRTEAAADAAAKELQEFYDKFFVEEGK